MRKRTGAGREITKTEAAEFFGVTFAAIDQWTRKGLPCERRGNNVYFNTSVVTQWLEAQSAERATVSAAPSGTLDEARVRKTNADAALAELQLQRERGEVVDIEEVSRTVGEEYAAVRAKLLAIPTKLAPRIALEDSEAACRDLIEREITEALNELIADGAAESVDRKYEAAAETDGEPMGGPVSAAIA